MKKFARFVFVGITGFAVHSLLYLLAKLIGLDEPQSAAVSVVLKASYEFFFTKEWTFKNKGYDNIGQQAGQFIVLLIVLNLMHFAALSTVMKFWQVQFLSANALIMATLGLIKFFVCRKIFPT